MADTLTLEFTMGSFDNAQKAGFLLLAAIFEKLSGDRSGRYYPVPGNKHYDRDTPKEQRAANYHVKFTGAKTPNEIQGGSYQASAPGEPPAVRTGRLRHSFYMTITGIGGDRYKVKISTNIYYADDLEYGTERIAARPFLTPTMEKYLPILVELEQDLMLKIIRGQLS